MLLLLLLEDLDLLDEAIEKTEEEDNNNNSVKNIFPMIAIFFSCFGCPVVIYFNMFGSTPHVA